jgi:hypothetical protein
MLFRITEIEADLTYLILQVIKRYFDCTRCAVGIEQNKGCRAAGTGVSDIVTDERGTRISRARAVIERFITVLGTGTEEAVIRTGVTSMCADSPITGIRPVTVEPVITGIRIIGMGTHAGPVTLIVGTDITVIGTGGA